MLQVVPFTFNPFQENTYVLVNEQKECWIIDPGMYGAEEEKRLEARIEAEGWKPQQILNTHTHIDHVLGVPFLRERYGLPFAFHELELPVVANAKGSAMMFGFDWKELPQADFFLDVDKPLLLGQDTLELRLAPGHSPGSVVFYSPEGKWLIGGDVLFQGSVGRTDLPGGDTATLMESIARQVYTLPDDTRVYSGHGPATTIGHEKRTNPFIQG